MSDYLTNLLLKSFNLIDVLHPRPTSRFETADGTDEDAFLEQTTGDLPAIHPKPEPMAYSQSYSPELPDQPGKAFLPMTARSGAGQPLVYPALPPLEGVQALTPAFSEEVENVEKGEAATILSKAAPPGQIKLGQAGMPEVRQFTAVQKSENVITTLREMALQKISERISTIEKTKFEADAKAAEPNIPAINGLITETTIMLPQPNGYSEPSVGFPVLAIEPAPPVIQVSIGRIEIKATQNNTKITPPREQPRSSQNSLDEYLQKRTQGGQR